MSLRHWLPFLLLLLAGQSLAQTPKSPTFQALLDRKAALSDAEIKAFWDGRAGKGPLVESVEGKPNRRLVTFVFRGHTDTKGIILLHPVPTFSQPTFLNRLGATDIWWVSLVLPSATRLRYGFHEFRAEFPLNDEARMETIQTPPTADPLNPKKARVLSILELEDALPYKWCEPRANVAKGSLVEVTLKSQALGRDCKVAIYVPANHKPSGTHNLLITYDAEGYGAKPGGEIPTPTIVDNLVADGKIGSTVVAMVYYETQDLRMKELTCSKGHARFVAEDLVPYMRKQYGAGKMKESVVLGGSSLGGLQAMFTAHLFPQVIGNVLSQGGAFWFFPEFREGGDIATRFGWLNDQIASGASAKGKVYLGVDLFEQDNSGNPVLNTRSLAMILKAKGRQVIMEDYAGGHEYSNWKATFGDALIKLIGR